MICQNELNVGVVAYASVLRLTREDVRVLKIKDAYSLHRVVYGLFDDVRSDEQKRASVPSGIIFADKGGDFNSRQILILSNRSPHQTPQFGEVETRLIQESFLTHERYALTVVINPSKRDKHTSKIQPIRGREAVAEWFVRRAPESWGFSVNPDHLLIEEVSVQTFEKDGKTITHGSAKIKGELTVTDRDRFVQSFTNGIGRGRTFGFGLLQIVPITN
ncbi:MAG: type I-E CRISPR-associated protein Cas6/Cse3/CasE [Halothiobacillus sp.]|jgi:CRISPR system Cascade subunit CasE|nr:type I-E CRISPR-associated protein Cas6/Cse3/CasE [Halothiobacillus sp.]